MTGFVKQSVCMLLFTGWILTGVLCNPVEAARPLVKKINTESAEGKFTLRVFLSARLPPQIFALDAKGKNPRVVVDFNRASGLKGLPRRIKSTSPMVRRIRVGIHKKPKRKIRLVLDLVPGLIYRVDQWFRRDNNSYILVLSAQ